LPGPLERGCDRGLAVGLDLPIAGHPSENLIDDRLRVFAPRVVGRDDRGVGEAGDDVAHERPLAPVAVPAAAEDADEAAGCDLARLCQDVLERLRRVRVVDEDRERLTLVHSLEPARNPGHVLDAGGDRLRLAPQTARGLSLPPGTLTR